MRRTPGIWPSRSPRTALPCARRLAEKGVQTDIHYPIADHRQAPFAAAYREVQLPNTEWVQERIFSLPCFPDLTDGEIDQVCEALRDL